MEAEPGDPVAVFPALPVIPKDLYYQISCLTRSAALFRDIVNEAVYERGTVRELLEQHAEVVVIAEESVQAWREHMNIDDQEAD